MSFCIFDLYGFKLVGEFNFQVKSSVRFWCVENKLSFNPIDTD